MLTRTSPVSIRRSLQPLAAGIAASLAGSGPAVANDFCFFATPYEVQNSPSCVVQADFNGDGLLDLVVANHEFGQDTISVLMNNGDGTFAAAVNYPVLGRPYWLGAGDLDGDLDADVVVSNYFGHTVSVLLNDGSGALGTATDYPVGFFPTILSLARLDGDDTLDIAVASAADSTVAVLLNNGDGTYLPPAFYPVGTNPYGVAAADFDGDGFVDLAVANYDAAIPSVSVLRNNGDGTFADQVLVPVADAPVGIASADLDGDGRPELVVTDYGPETSGNQVEVFVNDGTGGFPAPIAYTVGTGPYWVDLADVNDDGHPDIVSANEGGGGEGSLAVLLNDGVGGFGPAQFYEAGYAPGCVAVGDLDGNGSPELVATSYGDYSVFVLFNQYPVIVSDPIDLAVSDGDSAQFVVVVDGPPPFAYQWRRNGVDLVDGANIFGSTTDTLTLAPASGADAGVYDVAVTNDCSTLTSAAAILSVAPLCPKNGDLDGDGFVNGADLGLLLGAWGACPSGARDGACCFGDLSGDGVVNGADLGLLLANWTS